MASAGTGWSITRNFQNSEYTHNWAIENFDLAFEMEGGKIESSRFCIPGVPGEFHLEVAKKVVQHCYETGAIEMRMPSTLQIGGHHNELKVTSFFSVTLKSTTEVTVGAGKLDIIKEGADTLSGKFGDPDRPKLVPATQLVFRPSVDIKYRRNSVPGAYYSSLVSPKYAQGLGFYTTGDTALLTLVATITNPGKIHTFGGTEEEEEMAKDRLLDFEPFLSDPKHSDIVLNCGDKSFLCHKVILAAR